MKNLLTYIKESDNSKNGHFEEFVDEESRLAGGYDLYVENDKIKANITRNSDIKKQKEQEQNRKQKSTQVNTKDLTDEER